MNQTTTDRKLSSLLTADSNGGHDMLQEMADKLLDQAKAARKSGDHDAAARLMRAAANIIGDAEQQETRQERIDGRKQTTPETEKIKAMLREGWREAHELQEATKLNANRVHSLLGRLKNSRELKFEKRVITQYRLLP